MKKIHLSLIFLIIALQHNQAQDFKNHLNIIQTIFLQSQLVEINGMDVVKTKARGKHAHIPINSSSCYLLEITDKLSVLAFNIYLSENEDDYREMEENEIYNVFDIEEGSGLDRLKQNERLIQVVFFDKENRKFIAKPSNFPIEGLNWVPEGMGDFTEFISVNNLKRIKGSNSACVLQLYECPSCGFSSYVFKLKGNEVIASIKQQGCYTDFEESSNNIYCNHITNCYEVEYDGAEPVLIRKTFLSW